MESYIGRAWLQLVSAKTSTEMTFNNLILIEILLSSHFSSQQSSARVLTQLADFQTIKITFTIKTIFTLLKGVE